MDLTIPRVAGGCSRFSHDAASIPTTCLVWSGSLPVKEQAPTSSRGDRGESSARGFDDERCVEPHLVGLHLAQDGGGKDSTLGTRSDRDVREARLLEELLHQ